VGRDGMMCSLTGHLFGSHVAKRSCADGYHGLEHYQCFEPKSTQNPQHLGVGNLEDYTPQSRF
jgi:hypothetical protein